MIRVLIPLADGVEEMEAVIPADIFRRAEWTVVLAGLKPGPVTASRKVVITPDTTLDAVVGRSFDLLFLPGGLGGTEAMMADMRVLEYVRHFSESPRWVAAICAAPLVLEKANVLADRAFTCYPGVASRFTQGKHRGDRMVLDHRVYTSVGAGSALEFALHLVADLESVEKARRIAGSVCAPPGIV